MIIFIRHSKDSSKDAHRHDGNITESGASKARRKARKLIRRYGPPNKIIASPFQRTRETAEFMQSQIPTESRPDIAYDARLSRYFSRKEKMDPSIFSETNLYTIPIQETWTEFGKRVDDFVKSLRRRQYETENVIWVITHALVYKHIAKAYKVDIPTKIPFMHWFRIRRINKTQ